MKPDYLLKEPELTDEQLVSLVDDLPFWSAPFGLQLLENIKVLPHSRLLDVGCGAGFPLIELAARMGSTSQCFGIDLWPAAVKRAREKAAAWGLTQVTVEQAAAESLPFADHFFDVVISNNGMNNVQDEIKAWTEVGRVAKSGALLVITANMSETFHEFYAILINSLEKHGHRNMIGRVFDHIYEKRKPLDHLRQLLAHAGFQLDRIQTSSFDYHFSNGSAMLNHHLIRLAFMPSWRALLPEELSENILHDVEQEMNRIAASQGGWRMSVPWTCITAVRL
ncbi:MAG: methyltransferase domain-containing protein [Calditrichaeota bacterium]|nr:MAG: methyltransferase domain-containing protein [Calditrichota bacterium]